MRSARIYLKRLLAAFFLVPCLLSCAMAPQTSPLQVLSAQWEKISLPTSANGSVLASAVSPDNPDSLYICANDLRQNSQILLWHSGDAGKHWSQLPLPTTIGSDCDISIDPDHAQFMAVNIVALSGKERACDRDVIYQSRNGGGSWQHIPHTSIAPANGAYGFCVLQAAAPYLYLWTTSIPSKSPQLSMLERTGNNGAKWSRIDEDFGPYSLFSPPRIGQDGKTLAASVIPKPVSGSRSPSALWISQDAGQSWQQMGQVPGGTMLYTPTQLSSSRPSSSLPFYNVLGEQLPENLQELRAFQSVDGQHWSALPPLPVTGTSAAQPGLLQVLAAMSDGRLLAFGIDPEPEKTPQASSTTLSAFSLWIWNPGSAHWQAFSPALTNSTQENCALCWSALISTNASHQSYLYLSHLSTQALDFTLFRVRIPDTH